MAKQEDGTRAHHSKHTSPLPCVAYLCVLQSADRVVAFRTTLPFLPTRPPPPPPPPVRLKVVCWCAHQRQAVCVHVWRLAPSAGYCGCSQTLWRFRGWSKSRTSKAQLGTDIQITVNTMKEWHLNCWNVLRRDINTRLSHSFLTVCISASLCYLLVAEITKRSHAKSFAAATEHAD